MKKITSHQLLTCPAERLVISGYRNMMAAIELSDGACWEELWRDFTHQLGSQDARRTVGEVQYWVRTLRASSERPLSFYPHRCLYLCEDENFVVSLIGAAQSNDKEAGRIASELLTGSVNVVCLRDVWHASIHFATALRCSRQMMQTCPRNIIARISSTVARERQIMKKKSDNIYC